MKILIADSAAEFCTCLKEHLLQHGFSADCVSTGADFLRLAPYSNYDLILLDAGLSDPDGFTLCKACRNLGYHLPIIFISDLCDSEQRVTGLECGADDFMEKPFCIDVLIAKIRALLRRKEHTFDTAPLTYADLVLDEVHKQLKTAKNTASLTPQEYAVIYALMQNSTSVVPSTVLDVSEEELTPLIDTLSRILNKLESRAVIIPIRGVGYKLCA